MHVKDSENLSSTEIVRIKIAKYSSHFLFNTNAEFNALSCILIKYFTKLFLKKN